MDEVSKREFFRLDVRLEVEFHRVGAEQSSRMKVDAFDLSESGLGLRTDQNLKPGDTLMLTLRPPGFGQINAEAKVMNVEPDEHEKAKFRAGCKFVAISRRDQNLIADYIVKVQAERLRWRKKENA